MGYWGIFLRLKKFKIFWKSIQYLVSEPVIWSIFFAKHPIPIKRNHSIPWVSDRHKFIIRIDDYPTGVRDKIDNYRKFADQILNEFERFNIPYMLAVVPAFLEPEDHVLMQIPKT